MALSDYFVSTDWLADHLEDEDIRLVDATVIFNPTAEKPQEVLTSGQQIYQENHIPGAIHADLFDLNQTSSDIPFTFGQAEKFADTLASLGLGEKDTQIIVYDQLAMVGSEDKCQFWASRFCWQMAQIGLKQFKILDGGFHQWKNENRPVESGINQLPALDSLDLSLQHSKANSEDVKKAITHDDQIIVDTLPSEQYAGQLNPFGDDSAGHIPSAVNLYYGDLTDNQTGLLKDQNELKTRFNELGLLNPDKQIITYCGFGVGASWVQYILNALGQDQVKLYDGSMTAWIQEGLPVEK